MSGAGPREPGGAPDAGATPAVCPGEASGRCAGFRAAMEVLGKPWNGLLLKELEHGPVRFSALAERLAPIGDRMLSCRLKELEQAGLVVRAVDPGPPVRVSYDLSELGRGLRVVTEAIEDWGMRLLEARSPEVAACAEGPGERCLVDEAP